MDGINRIVMLGIPGSGKRSLMSAIMYTMMHRSVHIDGNLLTLRTLAEEELANRDADYLQAGLQSYDRLKPFQLEAAFRGTGDPLPPTLDLQVIINSQHCGRTVFMNLNDAAGQQVRDTIHDGGISAIVVLVDAGRVLRQDTKNIQKLAERLEDCLRWVETPIPNDQHCFQPDTSVQLLFVVTKADLIPEAERGAAFFAKAEQFCEPVCKVCRTHKRSWHWMDCSAAGIPSDRVFRPDGSLQDAPDFAPWHVDKLMCCLLWHTTVLLKKRTERLMQACQDSIRRRKGRYSRQNVRAMLELEEARTYYCKAVLGHAPLVYAEACLEKMKPFWENDVKEGK